VTTECSQSDSSRPSRPACRFNPFEIAVCGPDADVRSILVARLTAYFETRYTIGHVMERDPQLARETVELMGASLIVGDGQHGLMYPEYHDDFLSPRPLMDVDLVVVESANYPGMAKLVAVGDGTLEEDYEDVIAYVGAPEACPILRSDAEYYTLDQMPGIFDRVDAHLRALVEHVPLHGLVLAGGMSTRMGRDKAALQYHGKPQVAHCHELLSAYCEGVYVSCRLEQTVEESLANYESITDSFVGIGPMGGILSALRLDPHAAWLVLACDLPYVTEETLETLVHCRNPFKPATAFMSAHDGFPEPLCAIYEPKSVHRLLAFLARGYQCPRKVLINSDTQLIEAPEHGELDNVNHPHEYEAARNALNRGVKSESP
jgi:molybdopterin-guanine dinucleotide biosynthesis protein A